MSSWPFMNGLSISMENIVLRITLKVKIRKILKLYALFAPQDISNQKVAVLGIVQIIVLNVSTLMENFSVLDVMRLFKELSLHQSIISAYNVLLIAQFVNLKMISPSILTILISITIIMHTTLIYVSNLCKSYKLKTYFWIQRQVTTSIVMDYYNVDRKCISKLLFIAMIRISTNYFRNLLIRQNLNNKTSNCLNYFLSLPTLTYQKYVLSFNLVLK